MAKVRSYVMCVRSVKDTAWRWLLRQQDPEAGATSIRRLCEESTTRTAAVALSVLLPFLVSGHGTESREVAPLSATELAGIWKLCYEPGLPGVKEVSGAYLVLMPDLTYYEVREDCCRPPDAPASNPGVTGRYSIEGQAVVQHCVNVFGKPYNRRLRFVPDATVVTFDARKGPVIHGPALQVGDNLNYGYVKVFWHEDWLTP